MSQNTETLLERPNWDEQQDEIFDALVSHRSRYVLYACIQTDEPLTLSEITKQVAAWEYNKDVSDVTSDEHKRIYTSLQQHHLPKLERAGLITVENEHKRIQCTEKAANLDLYIELVPQSEVPWSLYYLGYGLISAFVLGLAYVDVLPEQLSFSVLAVLVVLGLVVSSLVHYSQSQQFRFDSEEPSPGTRS